MKVIAWDEIPQCKDEPNFGNLLTVLQRKVPARSTLFEFFLNDQLYRRLVPGPEPADETARMRRVITAFYRLGYDYASIVIPGFSFKEQVKRRVAKSISINEGAVIHNRQEFDKFAWPDANTADYDILDRLAQDLPKGMKLILFSPDGVLENVINLLGYEALCYLLVDDLQLVEDVVAQVGTRLVRYYEKAMSHDCVGACISNDDWGFKTGTLLSPAVLRRLIFPWHKRIVDVVHAADKPIILHSCGFFEHTIEDIIENMRFDGRHSYEDTIMTVETAYEKYHDRIAIIGGMDMDFICRSSPEEVYQRSQAMLERVITRGGYALGTGNSVPEYVPEANYFAMVRAALDLR